MRKPPRVGLSMMPTEDFRAAASPLFEAGEVEALEWSLDMTWGAGKRRFPKWVDGVLDLYASAGSLHGHGVFYSALSASWGPRHEEWLVELAGELRRRRYVRVSEHFGFMAVGRVVVAPFPVPKTEGAVRIGREALARFAEVVGAPIGLENNATAFGRRDVEEQGEFLDELLAPTDGWVLLDLHNIVCQAANFAIPVRELMKRYPLDRVRELHVAGGSVSHPPSDPGRTVRRDTHDGAIPDDVWELIPHALEVCPNAEVVFFERLGGTLGDADHQRFRDDFRRLKRAVRGADA